MQIYVTIATAAAVVLLILTGDQRSKRALCKPNEPGVLELSLKGTYVIYPYLESLEKNRVPSHAYR